MKHKTLGKNHTSIFGVSPLVRRFASRIAVAASGDPILDVACGSGRNAALLLELGCRVVCIDKDQTGLQNQLSRLPCSGAVTLQHLDLARDPWPFGAESVGGIINVHFLRPALFPCFERSLRKGGYLLLESVPGCGKNYLELPSAGEVQSALGRAFDFEFYKERKVGPHDSDAVTVKAVARRS
jgi:SAM-dependent methyltransferase